MNNFQLPPKIVDRLNYLSGYFDNAVTALIENSIETNLNRISPENIKILQESLLRSTKDSKILLESTGKSGVEIIDADVKRGDSLLRMALAKKGVILEAEETPPAQANQQNQPASREAIMGDDEDPQEDVGNNIPATDQDAQQTITAQDQTQVNPEQDPGANPNDPNSQNPALTPDQTLQLELAQTDNKFVTIVLYDKIVNLIGSIDVIKENISSNQTEDEMDFIDSLDKYKTYLEILNELIFVMDTNTIYYNVATIQLEVNDLLDKYLEVTKIKKINNNQSTNQDKRDAAEDLEDIDELDKEYP